MTVRKFPCISDAAETDREFYRNLSPAERPEILLELLNMRLSNNLREFCELLNSHGVES